MNRYYSYPNINLWDASSWDCKINALTGLIEKIGELPEDRKGIDEDLRYQADRRVVKSYEGYNPRNNCYNDPSVISCWSKKGMRYLSRSGNQVRHVYLMPKEPGCPYVVIYHKEDYEDPFWAMKTLGLYADYCAQAAEKRFGLAFVVTDNEPDRRRTYYTLPAHTKPYRLDQSRMYLDLGLLKDNGLALADVDFRLLDKSGAVIADPDAEIEDFYGHPVLNVSGRTYENSSLTYKSATPYGFNNGRVDFDAIYHSETGKKLAEGMRLEHECSGMDDEAAGRFLDDMGLRLEKHSYGEDPWWIFVPESLDISGGDTLPLLCIPHFPLTGELAADIMICTSFYLRFLKAASECECMVMFFPGDIVCGRVDDKAYGIIEECADAYHADKSRIYLAGHSRQGHVVQYLARKKPWLFAGVAALNDSPCIAVPDTSTEDILVTDAEIDALSGYDLPTIIVSGMCEDRCFFPISTSISEMDAKPNMAEARSPGATAIARVNAWNRRLRSLGCPEITFEEAVLAKESPERVQRLIGVPAERTDILYLDGHEHYIMDIKNREGNYHFRVVAEENMPHLCTPSGMGLAWSFLRQFARNTVTGETEELQVSSFERFKARRP